MMENQSSYYPKTIILRHKKENLKKCSLRGLESRNDMQFYTYPKSYPENLDNYILLTIDAEELSEKDQNLGLFLIDGTWNLAAKMERLLPNYPNLQKRSLPKNLKTAYPRVQTGCLDPDRGLASIEALYAAYIILKRPTEGLMNFYYFKEKFDELNSNLHSF